MKTMIISDIHGYSKNLKIILEIIKRDNIKRLIILGDLLSPGSDYEEVKELLNNLNISILCMKGNNDNYIYPGELNFNIIDDYLNIKLDSNNTYITHGHKFNKNNLPIEDKDIIIVGHTHICSMCKDTNKYFLNPGSISLPRDNTDGTYIIYEDNKFYLYDIYENLLNYLEIERCD
ncbi:MAG: phosphodiesterase [Bacilli bacterium]|nr:phosphodiesterase [Bacilli bacterium]